MKNIYLLLFVFLCSCGSDVSKIANKSISVNKDKIEKEFILDDELATNKYIVLENTSNSTIGRIDKFIINENKIYILDKEITKSLFVFSIEGDFLYKINNLGKGPGEYIAPDDFSIDNLRNEILISDLDQKKILYYHKDRFVREKHVLNEFSFISHTKNNVLGLNDFCMDDKDCFKLLIFDKDFNIIDKVGQFKRNDNRIMWELQIPMFQDSSGVYITEAFSNTIHKIDNELNYMPYVTINFHGEEISQEEKNKSRDKFLSFLSKTDKAFLVDHFLKSNDIEYFTFFYNQTLTHNFSIKNKTISSYSIINENKISFFPIYVDKNYLYSKVDAIDIIEKDKNYQEKMEFISEISNPIIVKTPLRYIKNKIINNPEK